MNPIVNPPFGGRSAASSWPRWARRFFPWVKSFPASRKKLWYATGRPVGGGGT